VLLFRTLGRLGLGLHPEHAHRLGNVFERLGPKVVEIRVHPSAGVSPGVFGQTDSARLRQGLQPRGDIHAVAENIVVLDNDVAEIDADAKLDPLIQRCIGHGMVHRALPSQGAFDGVHHAGKFNQQAVAHQLDHAPPVPVDDRFDGVLAQSIEAGKRACLVIAHQARIANHVCGQNSCQASHHYVSPCRGD